MKKRATLSILIIAAFLTACSSSISPEIPLITVTSNASLVGSKTSTASPTKTITMTPEPSMTLTPSPTQTNTQTRTPLPTLSYSKALGKVLELEKTNGGCKLPCYWGITPGVTTWQSAIAFLSPFATEFWSPNIDQGGAFFFPYPADKWGDEIGIGFVVENNNIVRIRASKKIPLYQLLSEYGQPQEIWIKVVTVTVSTTGRFKLVLFYPNQGFLAAYDGIVFLGDIVNLCPYQLKYPWTLLWFWPPSKPYTFREIADPELTGYFEMMGDYTYFPLEEVAPINVTTFYEIYRDKANQKQCFEMPAPDRTDDYK